MHPPKRHPFNDNQLLLYKTDDNEIRLEVLHEEETVWLSQLQMAALFHKDVRTINEHIRNIYSEQELVQEGTIRKFQIVQTEGNRTVNRHVDHYNLDVIISVGYRVRSRRGTQFRIWATQRLSEFIIKGFVMDDERLATGNSRYFDNLEERVRRIRLSEVNFYSKVRAIFTTSIDYDSKSQIASDFYATVQNKFHYAIHRHTAAELVLERIDPGKVNLGLTNWKHPKVFSMKDAFVAKNYLTELELKRLGLIVEQFLSFAELQTVERNPMTMANWSRKLDEFIVVLNEKPLLTNKGTVSRLDMEAKVREEYERYRERILNEEMLSEAQWEMKLLDAAETMLLPAPDDLETQGLSSEYYNLRIQRLAGQRIKFNDDVEKASTEAFDEHEFDDFPTSYPDPETGSFFDEYGNLYSEGN